MQCKRRSNTCYAYLWSSYCSTSDQRPMCHSRTIIAKHQQSNRNTNTHTSVSKIKYNKVNLLENIILYNNIRWLHKTQAQMVTLYHSPILLNLITSLSNLNHVFRVERKSSHSSSQKINSCKTRVDSTKALRNYLTHDLIELVYPKVIVIIVYLLGLVTPLR